MSQRASQGLPVIPQVLAHNAQLIINTTASNSIAVCNRMLPVALSGNVGLQELMSPASFRLQLPAREERSRGREGIHAIQDTKEVEEPIQERTYFTIYHFQPNHLFLHYAAGEKRLRLIMAL